MGEVGFVHAELFLEVRPQSVALIVVTLFVGGLTGAWIEQEYVVFRLIAIVALNARHRLLRDDEEFVTNQLHIPVESWRTQRQLRTAAFS
jgi:hypothetical protein